VTVEAVLPTPATRAGARCAGYQSPAWCPARRSWASGPPWPGRS